MLATHRKNHYNNMGNTVNMTYFLIPAEIAQLPTPDLALTITIFVIGLLGGIIGVVIARIAYGFQLKKSQVETEEFRKDQHEAQLMVTKLQENEHQLVIQLEGQREQVEMLRNQLQASHHTLEQAKEGWRASVKDVQSRDSTIHDLRATIESLHLQLANIDQTARERNHEMEILKNQLSEANLRNKDLQRLASERQAALSVANTDVSRFRSRFVQVGQYTSEANAYVRSLLLQLEAIQQRVLDLDLGELENKIIDGTSSQPASPNNSHYEPASKPNSPVSTVNEDTKGVWNEPEQPVLQSQIAHHTESPSTNGKTNDIAPEVVVEDDYGVLERIIPVNEKAVEVDQIDTTPPVFEVAEVVSVENNEAEVLPPVVVLKNKSDVDLSTVRSLRNLNAEDALKLEIAGIVSVYHMANATEAQLKQIIRAPKWRTPPYAEWIAEARELSK